MQAPVRNSTAVFLTPLSRYGDFALLALRLLVGAFLIWGVADNIVDPARMREFEQFLAGFGFPAPELMAPLSVWAQTAVGLAFIFGLLTRWAGVVCVINFAVGLVMVDRLGGIRTAFPSACLIAIGLYLATNGAGRFSLDHLLERGRVRNTPMGNGAPEERNFELPPRHSGTMESVSHGQHALLPTTWFVATKTHVSS